MAFHKAMRIRPMQLPIQEKLGRLSNMSKGVVLLAQDIVVSNHCDQDGQ